MRASLEIRIALWLRSGLEEGRSCSAGCKKGGRSNSGSARYWLRKIALGEGRKVCGGTFYMKPSGSKKEEFPATMENMLSRNSFPQIWVVS